MTRHSYWVVMLDHGRLGRESVVDPEITRAAVVDRLRRLDFISPIAFIHHVEVDDDGRGTATDVTNELLQEAGFFQLEFA